jgi:tetratricopeptide (TPR) repeat protein
VAFVRAERQARIARAVNAFLTDDLLAAASPDRAKDPDVRMRAVLDAAAARIGDRFAGEPLIAATIRRTLAETYTSLGLYDAAEPHAEAALALQLAHAAASDRETLAARRCLGILRHAQGRYGDAERDLQETADALAAGFGPDDADALAASADLALVHLEQDRLDAAEQRLVETARRARTALGDTHRTTLRVHGHLARLYDDQKRWAEAETLYGLVWSSRRCGGRWATTAPRSCRHSAIWRWSITRSAVRRRPPIWGWRR